MIHIINHTVSIWFSQVQQNSLEHIWPTDFQMWNKPNRMENVQKMSIQS